ncbi:hypothetical protein Pcinc_033732 [Petrolisthes cinctipes]|uniref:Uncharacterized protein n=1 Tax=Petrolisthes cinctipes TaxID=88211 RepID=A0AAE1ERU1_PETCI|nr:hypothetical protein Pcinc_033732 [Petrolisthes cinctipes]
MSQSTEGARPHAGGGVRSTEGDGAAAGASVLSYGATHNRRLSRFVTGWLKLAEWCESLYTLLPVPHPGTLLVPTTPQVGTLPTQTAASPPTPLPPTHEWSGGHSEGKGTKGEGRGREDKQLPRPSNFTLTTYPPPATHHPTTHLPHVSPPILYTFLPPQHTRPHVSFPYHTPPYYPTTRLPYHTPPYHPATHRYKAKREKL